MMSNSEHGEKNNGNGGGDQSGHGGGSDGHGGPGNDGGNGGKGHNANIVVDDRRFEVREGVWLVGDLKAKTGVDPAKVLAEITPNGLVDLNDAASIKVEDGMKFMSHVRSGASS